jgi:3-hydroxyisobutyrate dehydrogenase
MERQQVGIVGVGLMGSGIATNVLKAGWPVHFLDHPGNQPTAGLVEGGATAHATPAAIAAAADILILCVTGSPQVEAVLAGETGLLAGLREGTTVIDCSTAIPSSTLRVAESVRGRGGRFLDAPMTRTPKEAMEGRLNLIVGGERDDFERMLPLLRTFAESIAYAGPTGAGHTMKLLHNFVSLGFSAVLAEAAAAARRAGVDPGVFHAVLNDGGGRGVVLDRFASYLEDGDPSGFRFTLANGAKDIGYFVQMMSEVGGPGPVARAVESVYAESVAAGRGDDYVPTLISILSERGT